MFHGYVILSLNPTSTGFLHSALLIAGSQRASPGMSGLGATVLGGQKPLMAFFVC